MNPGQPPARGDHSTTGGRRRRYATATVQTATVHLIPMFSSPVLGSLVPLVSSRLVCRNEFAATAAAPCCLLKTNIARCSHEKYFIGIKELGVSVSLCSGNAQEVGSGWRRDCRVRVPTSRLSVKFQIEEHSWTVCEPVPNTLLLVHGALFRERRCRLDSPLPCYAQEVRFHLKKQGVWWRVLLPGKDIS